MCVCERVHMCACDPRGQKFQITIEWSISELLNIGVENKSQSPGGARNAP